MEHILHAENGLPYGTAKNAANGFRWLVDQGCIAVAGAYSSDNAVTVGPVANELKVPRSAGQGPSGFGASTASVSATVTAAATPRWSSPLKRKGYTRIAVLSEVSPNGEEYFRFLRQECRRRDISIAAVETVGQTPAPQTHIACSPHEHGMFRGDWLLYGRVTDGELEFEGRFEQWE